MIYTRLPDIRQAIDRYRHGKSSYTRLRVPLPFPSLSKRTTSSSTFNFRVGERSLLKWSEEDYVNLGEDDDNDDDFMVNARAEDLTGADDLPLAPSPRKGGGGGIGHKSYGSIGGVLSIAHKPKSSQ